MLDIFKKQFIDVIEWVEPGNGILAYRFPTLDREIQNGAQLTVRESQVAMFVNEGYLADVFDPGLYELSTNTLPVLTTIMNWDKAFKSPFKSEVYFFSKREQLDQRWGTQAPITIRDKEFGVIRLRAHGTYSYQLSDPAVFYEKVSGTRDVYTAEELDGQLRAMILTNMAVIFGNADTSFLDMAANQMAFSQKLQTELSAAFAQYGLRLVSFYVQSITLPEELERHLDKVSSMKMVGDLKNYARFQAADSLDKGGDGGMMGTMAGAGLGLGAGAAMGQTLAGMFNDNDSKGGGGEDPIAKLNQLHELLTKGVITQEEFDAKKAELLKKI